MIPLGILGAAHMAVSAGSGYYSAVLADSPWAFWEANETSGSTLADSSGSGRDLTVTGTAPTFNVAGPVAGIPAIAWPATSPSYAIGTATGSITVCTIELWVYVASLPTDGTKSIFDFTDAYAGGTNDKNVLLNTDGSISWRVYTGSPVVTTTPAGAIATGSWHHVVCSAGAAGGIVRIDGSTVATGASATTSFSGAMYPMVRGRTASGGDGHPMSIGPVAVFSTQLTDAQTDAHRAAA